MSKLCLVLIISKYSELNLNPIVQKKGLFSEFFNLLFETYARWKGTGEPCSNFSLKMLKIFPRHFWKIFSFLISPCGPLSHGIWILVQHLSIETLAFLEHSGHATNPIFVRFFSIWQEKESMPSPGFEPWTSCMWNQCANHSATATSYRNYQILKCHFTLFT